MSVENVLGKRVEVVGDVKENLLLKTLGNITIQSGSSFVELFKGGKLLVSGDMITTITDITSIGKSGLYYVNTNKSLYYYDGSNLLLLSSITGNNNELLQSYGLMVDKFSDLTSLGEKKYPVFVVEKGTHYVYVGGEWQLLYVSLRNSENIDGFKSFKNIVYFNEGFSTPDEVVTLKKDELGNWVLSGVVIEATTENALKWATHSWDDYIDQPVRTKDDVKFKTIDIGSSVLNNWQSVFSVDDNGDVIANKIQSKEFATGLTGYGFRLGTDSEFDSLKLRTFLEVPELRKNKIVVIGGEFWVTDAGIIESVETTEFDYTYKVNLKLEEGDSSPFQNGDILRGIFNHDNGFYTTFLKVIDGQGLYFIAESIPYGDQNQFRFPPVQAMTIARQGNIDNNKPERQRSIFMSGTSGYIRVLDGVNSVTFGSNNVKAQFGNLSGLSKEGFGDLVGYGTYIENAYIKGKLRQVSGDSSIALEVWRGEFDPLVSYEEGNKVSYNGLIYICVNNTTAGTLPINSYYWERVVDNVKYVKISGPDFFMLDGTNWSPDSITLTATEFGFTSSGSKWQYLQEGVWQDLQANVPTVTISKFDAFLVFFLPEQFIKIRYIANENYLDEYTIKIIRHGTNGTNGESPILFTLSTENVSVPCDSSGIVASFTAAKTYCKVFRGTIEETSSWSFSSVSTDVETSYDSINKSFSITNLLADIGYIDITASKSGETSLVKRFTVTKNKQGNIGNTGLSGPSVVYRGLYLEGTTYFNNVKRRDIVKYNSKYYMFKGEDASVPTFWNYSSWEEFGAQFESIATGILLAEGANIGILEGNEIHLGTGDNTGWILDSLSIKSRASTLENGQTVPKLELTEDGKIKARDAHITGKINTAEFISTGTFATPAKTIEIECGSSYAVDITDGAFLNISIVGSTGPEYTTLILPLAANYDGYHCTITLVSGNYLNIYSYPSTIPPLKQSNTSLSDLVFGGKTAISKGIPSIGLISMGGKWVVAQSAAPIIVDYYYNKSTHAWYRKYSDGWIEQGGTIYGSSIFNYTITLLTPFLFSDYSVHVNCIRSAYGNNGTNYVYDITTTTFSAVVDGGSGFTWSAKGY